MEGNMAAEWAQVTVSLLQTALIAWGIWLMSKSNQDRQANAEVLKSVADTLNTHTDALKQLLQERS